MSTVLSSIHRAFRHVTPARSKERYFSAFVWNDSWSQGYARRMDRSPEDARYGALVALMRRHEGEGPILDVGCGDGLLEEWYRKVSSVPIVAFDYSTAAIELAKARHLPGVEFSCGDGRTFQSAQQFSLVVLNESLYYVDDYLTLLKRLSSAMTADSLFLVSMHDTRITRRMWKNVRREYDSIDGVTLKHEVSGGLWHIRLLRPKG